MTQSLQENDDENCLIFWSNDGFFGQKFLKFEKIFSPKKCPKSSQILSLWIRCQKSIWSFSKEVSDFLENYFRDLKTGGLSDQSEVIFENRIQYEIYLKKLRFKGNFVQKFEGSKTRIGSVGQRKKNFDPISSGKRCGELFDFWINWSIFWSKIFENRKNIFTSKMSKIITNP